MNMRLRTMYKHRNKILLLLLLLLGGVNLYKWIERIGNHFNTPNGQQVE